MAYKLPPMKLRPIHVRYVAARMCRFNPSYNSVSGSREEEDLWLAWERRHPRRSRPDDEVSERPTPKRKKA